LGKNVRKPQGGGIFLTRAVWAFVAGCDLRGWNETGMVWYVDSPSVVASAWLSIDCRMYLTVLVVFPATRRALLHKASRLYNVSSLRNAS